MTTTAEWRKWNAVQTKPITNADRIRTMTDAELTEWMANTVDCQYCPIKTAWCAENEVSCRENWYDWLRQEAET